MNAFCSLLQNAVNANDINHDLYLSALKSFKNPHEILERIETYAKEIAQNYSSGKLSAVALGIEIRYETSMNSNVHAAFNPNTNQLMINQKWLDFLSDYLGEAKAIDLCLSHELTHAVESDYFKDLKRKQRNSVLEILAKKVSQIVVGNEFHPSLYEYAYALENNHYPLDTLVTYLKGVLS